MQYPFIRQSGHYTISGIIHLETKHNPIFKKRCRTRQQTPRCSLWNSILGLWKQIHWRNETKLEHLNESTPREDFFYKLSGLGFHLPGVHTPRRVGSQILVLRLPQFLHAPTQNSKDLEKSTNSCDPSARKATGGPKELSSNISAVCPL